MATFMLGGRDVAVGGRVATQKIAADTGIPLKRALTFGRYDGQAILLRMQGETLTRPRWRFSI